MMQHRIQIRRRSKALRTYLAENKTRAKQNNIMKSALQTLQNFCKETSIHGIRFIFEDIEDTGNDNIRRFQRMASLAVWLTVDILGVGFAIFLMSLIWTRFQNSPTMTTVETNNYPIWNVPFPGVTICNVNVVYKPNTKYLAAELKKQGFSEATIELYFQNLAALVNFEEVDRKFIKISHILEEMGYTTEKIMFELAHPCEKLFRHCNWLGKDMSCRNLFRTAKSAAGFCCSFNYKALRSQFEIHLPYTGESKLFCQLKRTICTVRFNFNLPWKCMRRSLVYLLLCPVLQTQKNTANIKLRFLSTRGRHGQKIVFLAL